MKLLITLLSILILNCTTSKKEVDLTPQEQKLVYKKYENELIGLDTSLRLAFSSYLLACSEVNKKFNNTGTNVFEECKISAQKHVNENVIFILNQYKNIIVK